jgi:hypothetical protein
MVNIMKDKYDSTDLREDLERLRISRKAERNWREQMAVFEGLLVDARAPELQLPIYKVEDATGGALARIEVNKKTMKAFSEDVTRFAGYVSDVIDRDDPNDTFSMYTHNVMILKLAGVIDDFYKANADVIDRDDEMKGSMRTLENIVVSMNFKVNGELHYPGKLPAIQYERGQRFGPTPLFREPVKGKKSYSTFEIKFPNSDPAFV